MPQPIRSEIQRMIDSISPHDGKEEEHLSFTKEWIKSSVDIFRIAKPATPDPHLVAYFLLADPLTKKILLVDHKKAGLWLPAGGHVELNEHPKETVKREIVEELGIQADFLIAEPFFLTVTKTIGQTAGHTDISLWYALKGSASNLYEYDRNEFLQVAWFSYHDIPYERSDPNLKRCINKLSALKVLDEPI